MVQPRIAPADHSTPETNAVPRTLVSEQNMNIAFAAIDEDRSADYTARVRALNDALRQSGTGGRMMMTAGIAALPRDEQLGTVAAVMAFEAFDRDDDPYGEHDFGSLRLGPNNVMWKIDYFDRSGRVHSPDPSDPAVTQRVLTVMLAEEY